ncbi:unnamed protein product [Amoebophrya sp. A25]|nr:unnamed protein product [Amoebophrya sp. A25]|eukprot:GSA25T00012894001.1
MSKIVAVPTEDSHQDVFPVARQIQSLMKEEKLSEEKIQEFERNFVEHIEKEDWYQIFLLFGDKCDLIVRQVDKKGKPAADKVECYFATLIYLLDAMDSIIKLEAAVTKVVQLLLSGTEYAQLRLKMLKTAYNSLPVSPKTAHLSRQTFFGVLNFAADNQLFHELLPYLNFFEQWVANWGEAAKETDRKEIFHIIATAIPQLKPEVKLTLSSDVLFDDEELAFSWMKKYLLEETEVNEQSLKAVKTFVADICRLPGVYQVEGLLTIPFLAEAAKKDASIPKMLQLLQLFVSGTVTDLEKFKSANPGLLESLGVASSDIENKLRVLSLCSLCEGRSTVPLAEVRKVLGAEDVDDLIIQAGHFDVLNARIDELDQTLHVQTVLQRSFGPKDWAHLDTTLETWINKIDALIAINNNDVGSTVAQAGA